VDTAPHVARELDDLLTGLAQRDPVALLIDDLHWADAGTLAVLQQLAASTRGCRVLLLATYREVGLARDHPLREIMRDLDREALVERVTVRRLTEDGTAALVAATIGELDAAEDFVEFVHRRTKGNPFYIDRMLRALGGHYRLVRQIGAGGMGRVFEALDTRTGEAVAAKLMFARTEADPRALQRFEQEGAVLATLTHPNIVQVRGVFLEERASCIVMEMLRGRSLGQMLQDGIGLIREGKGAGTAEIAVYPSLDLARVKHLAQQVAAALVCAHEHGIVHRDIKPDNVMVLDDDRVKVTDFGIARLVRPVEAVTTMTSTGMTMGTPLYMAPEQIEGRPVDGRADVYALGCVLYRMVTGRPPFEGDDPLTIIVKHVREAPRPPRELNPDLPKGWEALILKAIAKDPSDRFPSAAAMEKALAAVSDGAVRTTRSGFPLGVARSLPGRIAAGGAAIALVLGIFAYRTSFSSTPNGSPLGRLVATWSLPASSPSAFKQPVALAINRQGTFFVLDQGANRVVRLSASGKRLGSWGGLGSDRGQLRDPQALTLDRSGNLYVADSGNDRVEKFSPTGHVLAVWGHTGSELGQFRDPDGIAVDNKGFIYVSDAGNNRAEVLDVSGRPVAQNVGTFFPFYIGLNRPAGIAVNSRGEAYVADTGDNQIVHYSPDGVTVLGTTTVAGDPRGVALDSNGNMYVADAAKSEVQLVSPSLGVLHTWRAGGAGVGTLSGPHGIAMDAHGVAYLADSGNGRILKLSSGRQWVPAWGPSKPVQPPSPESLALDRRGVLYVADDANSRVVALSPSGQWLGSHELTSGFTGPIGGIAVDSRGSLLVTDYGGNHVLRLSGAGRVVGKWGSNPTGPGLTNPQGIAVDPAGNIDVADQGSNRILQYSSTGKLRTVLPVAANAPVVYPYGLAVDRQGSVYVTDQLDAYVFRVSPNGRAVAHWGTAGSGPGQLSAPEGIAVDSRKGRVYVADTNNHRVEVFSSTGKYLGSSTAGLVRPADVAVDSGGNVYVADPGSQRIEKFAP
jgi:serine/threonine protein kinase/sugar lactone lactonase YvrE